MIEVLFPEERDVSGWRSRHLAGEAPGLWPYGLDDLSIHDTEARIAELAAPSRFEAARARLLPSRRPRHPSVELPEVGITWDENTARLMALTSPRKRMFTGVIWITDIAARGGNTGRMREILRGMDGLWVISRGQLEPLREFVGDDGPPVTYFRFGVDPDFFPYRAFPERPMVLSVGGDRDRDAATLFEALDGVRRAAPETRIVVQTTSALTPPAGVETIEHVSHRELRNLYADASVVAIATRQNLHASGMTVSLEAMSTGRPVVMTRTPGIEDYVEHDVTGLLAPVGDPAALADGVVGLLGDPERAERLGRAGRAEVDDWGNTRAMAKRLASVVGVATGQR